MATIKTTNHPHEQSGLVVILKKPIAIEQGTPVHDILQQHEARSCCIFGTLTELDDEQAELAKFHRIHAPADKLEQLASELNAHDDVEAAYIKPPGAPPVIDIPAPTSAPAPSNTPNFLNRQLYLTAAPVGVDSLYAHAQPGGKGDGVTIVDCEWGWQLTHEDLQAHVGKGGIVYGTNQTLDPSDPNVSAWGVPWAKGMIDHGTSVVGVLSGDENPFGILGMVPNATIKQASFGYKDNDYAKCILEAAKVLNAGDIMLLEIHQPGPKSPRDGSQLGFIPCEWWPDQLIAIQAAVKKGIIVVEAAGNGYQNLDDEVYNTNPTFGAVWKNPLNPANPSSGAIIVGAGYPPPDTHNRNWGPDRSRCDFSNYGHRVDCQGWGREVTTTGYGDLQAGRGDIEYTDKFSGTSSASPIIVGVLASVQGVLKKEGKPLLTPSKALELLRKYGSPQEDRPDAPKSQRIGSRPNLKELIEVARKIA